MKARTSRNLMNALRNSRRGTINLAHCCRPVTEFPLSLIYVHGFVSLRHDFGLCAFEVQRLPPERATWLLSSLDALPGAADGGTGPAALSRFAVCPVVDK
jgi:hypothetical protein